MHRYGEYMSIQYRQINSFSSLKHQLHSLATAPTHWPRVLSFSSQKVFVGVTHLGRWQSPDLD